MDGNTLIGAHRQKFHLGLPFHKVVHRLDHVDPAAEAGSDGLRFHHLPRGKVRQADPRDVARQLPFHQETNGFFKRGDRIKPMQVEQVHRITPQPFPAFVELRGQIGTTGAARVANLGCNGDIRIVQCEFADKAFRLPIRIDVCGVEMRDPGRAGCIIHRAGGLCIGTAAELHATKGKGG